MDERSNAELTRDVARLEQAQVSKTEYAVTVAHLEQRNAELLAALAEERRERATEIAGLETALAEERRARQEAVDGIKKQIAEEAKGRGANFRQGIYNAAVPAIIFLLGIVATIIFAKGGK